MYSGVLLTHEFPFPLEQKEECGRVSEQEGWNETDGVCEQWWQQQSYSKLVPASQDNAVHMVWQCIYTPQPSETSRAQQRLQPDTEN